MNEHEALIAEARAAAKEVHPYVPSDSSENVIHNKFITLKRITFQHGYIRGFNAALEEVTRPADPEKCEKCRHRVHGPVCLNMESDNECECRWALTPALRPDWLKDTQPEQGGIPGLTEAEATAFQSRDWDEVSRLQDAPPVEGVREALVKAVLPHTERRRWETFHQFSERIADALLTEYTITPKETP